MVSNEYADISGRGVIAAIFDLSGRVRHTRLIGFGKGYRLLIRSAMTTPSLPIRPRTWI